MKNKKEIKLSYVLFIIVFLFASMFITLNIIGSDILQIPLILTCIVGGLVAFLHNYKWEEIIGGVLSGIDVAVEGILILLIIGMVIGSWIAAGTVQTIIVYGLELLSAKWFLPIAFLISCITSVATGSAWTSSGTVGVALMGIGLGLGVNPGHIGGAIVSGSFFGDKISPISDNTNVVSAAIGVDLFEHCRHTMYTAIPGALICLIIYFFMGLNSKVTQIDTSAVNATINGLKSNFVINPILLLPAILVLVCSALKIPSIPSLLLVTGVGSVLAYFVQGESLNSIFSILYSGFVGETGIMEVDRIITRGGLTSMFYNTTIALSALSLSGILESTGMLNSVLNSLQRFLKTRISIVITTMVTSWITLVATTSQHMSMIIPGRMFAPVYEKKGYKLVNLSRTLSDSGGLLDAIVPWSLSGVFMAGSLGISTLEYLPYAYFVYIVPVIAIIYAVTGFAFPKNTEKI